MKTPDDVATMRRLEEQGWGAKRIAAELRCSPKTVRRWLALERWQPAARAVRVKRLDPLSDWLRESSQRHAGNAKAIQQDLARTGAAVSVRTVERTLARLRHAPDTSASQQDTTVEKADPNRRKSWGKPNATADRRFDEAVMDRHIAGVEAGQAKEWSNPAHIFGADSRYELPIAKRALEVIEDRLRTGEPMPGNVLLYLRENLGQMVRAGKMPEAWTVLARRSGKKGWTADDPFIAGVRWIKAFENGELQDPALILAVADDCKPKIDENVREELEKKKEFVPDRYSAEIDPETRKRLSKANTPTQYVEALYGVSRQSVANKIKDKDIIDYLQQEARLKDDQWYSAHSITLTLITESNRYKAITGGKNRRRRR